MDAADDVAKSVPILQFPCDVHISADALAEDNAPLVLAQQLAITAVGINLDLAVEEFDDRLSRAFRARDVRDDYT